MESVTIIIIITVIIMIIIIIITIIMIVAIITIIIIIIFLFFFIFIRNGIIVRLAGAGEDSISAWDGGGDVEVWSGKKAGSKNTRGLNSKKRVLGP